MFTVEKYIIYQRTRFDTTSGSPNAFGRLTKHERLKLQLDTNDFHKPKWDTMLKLKL